MLQFGLQIIGKYWSWAHCGEQILLFTRGREKFYWENRQNLYSEWTIYTALWLLNVNILWFQEDRKRENEEKYIILFLKEKCEHFLEWTLTNWKSLGNAFLEEKVLWSFIDCARIFWKWARNSGVLLN